MNTPDKRPITIFIAVIACGLIHNLERNRLMGRDIRLLMYLATGPFVDNLIASARNFSATILH